MTQRRPTILIIDDDEHICYTLREICAFQGWEALTACSYPQAEQVLKSYQPDLLVVDYHLPVMDGVRVVRALRERYPQTPIIVLTIEEQERVMRRFMEAGADDFALKPIKALDLISRIKMHLKYAEQKRFYGDTRKGINPKTLERITAFLSRNAGYADIEDIVQDTNISQKSVYRYLQYLVDEGLVITHSDYGKIGRPRTTYRLRQKADEGQTPTE